MKRTSASILVACLALSLFGAFRYSDDLFEMRKNFEIFGALFEEISVNYVDEVRSQPFMRSGIEAMLGQLDPYTTYFDEADMVDMQLMQQRMVGSVGLNVGLRGGRLTVLAPENNAAAYKQGVRTGDVILQIGETATDNLTVEDAYGLLMGQPGTTAEIQIQRGEELTLRTFVLPRSHPRTQNVSFSGFLGPDSTEGIAYVKLDQFGTRSAREVRRAFRNMDQDVPLKGLILDLRSNPGGILGEAIDIVELFVPNGSLVVSTRSRVDSAVQEYRTDENPLFPDVPVVVLIDRFSASASEIVAGALQDHDRAVIMGETSFGKGLVQITRPLPHNTLLRLTVSHYYLPTGRTIQSFELNSASARVVAPVKTAFKTPSGRSVRGGLGVEPDENLSFANPGELESVLMQESAFFLFADRWIDLHCQDTSECIGDLAGQPVQVAPLGMFSEFKVWLNQSGIQLITETDIWLNKIEGEAKLERYSVEKEWIALKGALEASKNNKLDDLEAVVVSRIQAEIRSRLLAESDRIEFELRLDPVVARASDLVKRPSELNAILN